MVSFLCILRKTGVKIVLFLTFCEFILFIYWTKKVANSLLAWGNTDEILPEFLLFVRDIEIF